MTTPPDEVHVHLHFTMTGRYPLRLVDLLFCPDRVLCVEYDYVTPIDLLIGRVSRRAEAFAATVTGEGVAAGLETAERVREVTYADLETISLHDGGALGREKVAIRQSAGSNLAVRVHGSVDLDAVADALEGVLAGHAVTVEREHGLGLDLDITG